MRLCPSYSAAGASAGASGAKAGIDFVHSLPEPAQVAIFIIFGVVFIAAIMALAAWPFR